MLSDKSTVDISGNCIQDFSPIEDNVIEPFVLIGKEDQKTECQRTQTIFYQFDAASKDASTNEVEFTYRAWSSETTDGEIEFGDGETITAICDGNTNSVTHVYQGNGPFTAKLKLNGDQIEKELDMVFTSPVTVSPELSFANDKSQMTHNK